MDPINKVVELENNGSLTQIRVMEEQLVVNTVLCTKYACPGSQVETGDAVETSKLHKSLGDSRIQTSPDNLILQASSQKENREEIGNKTPLIEEMVESTSSIVEAVPSMLGPHPTLAGKPLHSVTVNSMQLVPFIGPSCFEQATRGLRTAELHSKKGKGPVTPYRDALMSNLGLPKPPITPLKGGSNRDRGMADFNNFIDDMEVMDLQLLGRNFTWSNNQEGEKWSRIDRFLLNFVWQRRNNTNTFLVNDEHIEDPKLVKKAVFNHFKSLYEEEMAIFMEEKAIVLWGRIVLIKVVLLSLPLYYMSIFKMPEGVIKSIESIQSRFLWGGSDLKRKIHLVAWSKLHQSKICGGLGIRDIKLLNEALLLKWWWRFGMDKSSLWRKVLNAKYSMKGRDWIPRMEPTRKVSTIWRNIMQVHIRQPVMFEAFMENAKLRFGDGSTIKFWKDIWMGNLPLQSQFSTLYKITINKSEFLSDVYIRFEETQRWDFLFRRPLLAREVEALEDLNELMAISGVEINLDRHDQLIWQGCPSEKFSVKSIYEKAISSHSAVDETFKLLWENVAPPRVQCFGFLSYLGRVKTFEYLLSLGIIQNEGEALCSFCNGELESLDHLLLHYAPVWNLLISGSPRPEVLCAPIPLAMVWSIWNVRNQKDFESKSMNWVEVTELVMARVAFWVPSSKEGKDLTMNDIIFRWFPRGYGSASYQEASVEGIPA
ncbi:hypothetical protein Acr_01g0003960 [Actinidia rufa]|uniref:Reverse transcriptase zinc-binding domain-containing protein n=1 Tax=Actinidia rufa TaxID=165716 RepID=A0A7J0E4K2_9ERIC|nr:hypothetical protein Acr_01g0003960 [Actinidia rufa]